LFLFLKKRKICAMKDEKEAAGKAEEKEEPQPSTSTASQDGGEAGGKDKLFEVRQREGSQGNQGKIDEITDNPSF
jgi:hypothetical protein